MCVVLPPGGLSDSLSFGNPFRKLWRKACSGDRFGRRTKRREEKVAVESVTNQAGLPLVCDETGSLNGWKS